MQRLGAAEALARLGGSGMREVIVLDLARVGPARARTSRWCGSSAPAFPELELLAGGGVRDAADLRALAEAGAAGALVATALHSGAIGRDDCARWVTRGASPDDGLQMLRECRRHVDTRRALHALPAGDAVDLEHVVAPSVVRRRSTPA